MNDTTKLPDDADAGRGSDTASGLSGGKTDPAPGTDPNHPTAQSEKAAKEQDDGAVPSEGY